MPTPEPGQPSKVEGIKIESNGLAGGIATSLASEATHFEEPEMQLMKFHGSYQQDNRDERPARRKANLDKAWSYMIRCRIPAGRMTAAQYLAMDDIGTQYTHDNSIRLTSRQSIQFHGVGREKLKGVIRAINDARLSTLSACGDVNRNVMACSVGDLDWRAGLKMTETADLLAHNFAPRSTAYWEIWCDGEMWGEKVVPTREEPLYGRTYMPRKWKMAVATPEDNDVDLYTQDVGWEVVHENGRLVGYDVIVGGGMGHSHGKTETYPRLGDRAVRIAPEDLIPVGEAILAIQRDNGDRTNRAHARFKYVMEEKGLSWFKDELFRRLGRTLPDAGPAPKYKVEDHLGWSAAPDGTLYVGIHIVNGRIIDRPGAEAKTGLREIVTRFAKEARLTPKQNIVLSGIDISKRPEIERIMGECGLRTGSEVSTINRLAMACPALPLCGLALAESERMSPKLIEELETLGVGDAPVEIRFTGCPNSCVRTPTAEIGIVGRGPGKYNINLGGNQEGTRLSFIFKETVTQDKLAPIVARLIEAWRAETRQAQSFGDWAAGRGVESLGLLLEEKPAGA